MLWRNSVPLIIAAALHVRSSPSRRELINNNEQKVYIISMETIPLNFFPTSSHSFIISSFASIHSFPTKSFFRIFFLT